MASTCMVITRQISSSSVCHGKRNFRMIQVYNKRGSRQFKEERNKNPKNFDIPIDRRGVKATGMWVQDRWVNVPEMIPEIVVPSLKDFHLKPYVSYRTTDVERREFTAQDLFDVVYSEKIRTDFKAGQLDSDGQPLNPSEDEKLTSEEARIKAEQTGCDLFQPDKLPPKLF
ncbi:39S ribosomal protein L41, mitochondrial [Ceratina calcarata]|uniref:39S ribosomal protein L41, mitochondrial n=1 Tax=Ceratina calcarata TaxID=156304 RepID=A0AAJ7ITJ6_9HYME|nr:39S ribosomal protein L41, mitochondrial [Ceratina calcarata]